MPRWCAWCTARATAAIRPGGGAGVVGEECQALVEAAALDQLHGEEVLPFVLADLVDGHDVEMVQAGRILRLAAKALDLGEGGQLARQDHLERHGPLEASLPGFVDDPHAAAGDFLHQFVIAEEAHRPQRRVRGRLNKGHSQRLGSGRRGRGSQRRGQPVEPVVVGEERPQAVGHVGVPGQPFVPVRHLSRLDRLQVRGDGVVEPRILFGRFVRRRTHGWSCPLS
jgi:hypothetical protein